MSGLYLMVLPVPAFSCGDGAFEIESAFAEHLRMLKAVLGPLAETLVIAAPELSSEARAKAATRFARIEPQRDGIHFHPMFPADLGRVAYLRALPRVLSALYAEVKKADIVHASVSQLYRPFEFPALMMASVLGKKTISVTDIDHRQSAWMNLETGRWSRREYWVTRLLHDPFIHIQQVIGARRCSLVLLKGQRMAADYGRGRSNVKYFLDSAFSDDHIIPRDRLDRKLAALAAPGSNLEVIYFGRLVEYKGIDAMLHAVKRAVTQGARVRFQVIGAGPAEADLMALAAQLELGPAVAFVGALPFGPPLFERLYDAHVLLAAPLSEDTPRSALDACAMGQAILSYDTYYYRELAELGAPVETVPWRDTDALGDRLVQLDGDRARIAEMIRNGVAFARENTQESWLERRVTWTRALFDRPNGAASPPS
jgi:glycosyltransferase involved in cell wall biosynthesis